jgi:hypothetical protein
MRLFRERPSRASKRDVCYARDRWFESGSLQQRVQCELGNRLRFGGPATGSLGQQQIVDSLHPPLNRAFEPDPARAGHKGHPQCPRYGYAGGDTRSTTPGTSAAASGRLARRRAPVAPGIYHSRYRPFGNRAIAPRLHYAVHTPLTARGKGTTKFDTFMRNCRRADGRPSRA